MEITEDDIEWIDIGLVDLGNTVISQSASGDPLAWRVNAKKHEWNERDGQSVILRSINATEASHDEAIKAPMGTLIPRVRMRR